MLYIVPTPIGNLGDMTLRAIEVLKDVDLVLAEDTRTSKKLLNHFGIETPCQSYHAHNEHKIVSNIIDRLSKGSSIALISDAGMPGVSDPGYLLIREAITAKIKLEILPGASAFLLGLLYSGFPNHDFRFIGFLPQKKGRQTALQNLATDDRTIVLYESPYRVLKLLKQLDEIAPDRWVSLSRELTKLHEETVRGTPSQLFEIFNQRSSIKGEFVVTIAPTGFSL